MNRRAFLRTAMATGLVGICGCLTDENQHDETPQPGTDANTSSTWDPSISGDEPALAPGAETTITVEASPVGGFQFSAIPDETVTISPSLDAANVSPEPDSGEDTYPPRWFWSSQTAVTVEVPVSVSTDANSGEYEYEVTVFPDEYAEQTRTESFTITVTE